MSFASLAIADSLRECCSNLSFWRKSRKWNSSRFVVCGRFFLFATSSFGWEKMSVDSLMLFLQNFLDWSSGSSLFQTLSLFIFHWSILCKGARECANPLPIDFPPALNIDLPLLSSWNVSTLKGGLPVTSFSEILYFWLHAVIFYVFVYQFLKTSVLASV